MRTVFSAAFFVLILAGAPALVRIDAFVFALVAVTVAALVTAVVEGAVSPLSLIFGAFGAFAFTLLWPVSPVLAGGALFAGLFAPRSLRAPGGVVGLCLHSAVAIVGGLAALWLVSTYLHDGFSVRAVSVVVAALLASAPWLLPVDDNLARALRAMAARNRGTTRWRLERAAALRREVEERRHELPSKEMKRIDEAFKNLVRLGRVRARANDADASVLDDTIAEHLSALEEGLRAIKVRETVIASVRRDAAHELRQESMGIEAEAEALSDSSAVPPHGQGVQSSI